MAHVNRLIIKRYTDSSTGATRYKHAWLVELLAKVKIRWKGRYIKWYDQRCTSIQHAASLIANCTPGSVIYAEWVDRNCNSIALVKNGKAMDSIVKVNRVTKSAKLVQIKKERKSWV